MENAGVYCQSRNVQFGGYKEFDHEPTAKETAEAVSKILNQILDNVFIRKLDEVKVILKTPEDFKNMVDDPLGEIAKDQPDRWTVGVKISCKEAGYGHPYKLKLDEGVSPDPMDFNSHSASAKPR